MFSQFLVQIFALYKYFRKNLRKQRRKFSMDPICKQNIIEIEDFEDIVRDQDMIWTDSTINIPLFVSVQIKIINTM